ncbi:type II toxin-antitoxin system RelE/ParE family toxin [soil metagenome]
MKTVYTASFVKDLKRLRGSAAYERIKKLAFETFSRLDDLSSVANLKKIRNADNAYRVRIGNYRVGFVIEGDTVTFKRVLHRKDIYRYFP